MKIKDIRELGNDELSAKARDLGEELFNLKFQHAIRPLDNTAKLRELRKDIARVKTIIAEKANEQQ